MMLTLTSNNFVNGGEMPSKYSCEGQNISPALIWGSVPESTQSLVLIVDDPDAPDPRAPKMTWVHWVLYNIPVGSNGMPEDASTAMLPRGAEQGQNDWKKIGYGGACPPVGRHCYFNKLYALDTVLSGMHKPTKSQIEAAMKGHIIEAAELVGTYEKTS